MKNRLIELFCIFSLLGFIGGAVVSTIGCKGLTPEAKQNIINGEKVACALANAFMSDPEIKALCNFADQETAPILNLVSMHRVALAQSKAVGVTEGASRAGACAPTPSGLSDAGATDAASGSVTATDAGFRLSASKDGGATPVPPKAGR